MDALRPSGKEPTEGVLKGKLSVTRSKRCWLSEAGRGFCFSPSKWRLIKFLPQQRQPFQQPVAAVLPGLAQIFTAVIFLFSFKFPYSSCVNVNNKMRKTF